MAWTYVVPVRAFEQLTMQLPLARRPEFIDRVRIEIHAELTRRLARGEGPGTVPTGMLSSDIESAASVSTLFFTGELNPDQIAERRQTARLLRSGGIVPPWAANVTATGPEWVYPGRAVAGLLRDAVDTVRLHGQVLVEEILAR